MPNHVRNVLTVDSNFDQIVEFMKSDEDEKIKFDFNKIIPMPRLLKNTGSGFITIDGVEYDRWYQECDKEKTIRRPFTEEELEELENIGFSNWYDWSVATWHTKWDAYNIKIEDNQFTFDTAWSNVTDLILSLSTKFPNTIFSYEYSDEDTGSQCGELIIKNGIVLSENIPKDRSNEAYHIAFKLRPYKQENYKLVDGKYKYFDNEDNE